MSPTTFYILLITGPFVILFSLCAWFSWQQRKIMKGLIEAQRRISEHDPRKPF